MAFRDQISRFASNSPRLFYGMKRVDLLYHYLFRRQFESEFLCFQALGQGFPGLRIVDVGANIGQSAIGFAQLFSASEIVSFEANPDLEPYLVLCSALLGPRFRYQMVGLSESPAQMTLHVPRRGSVYIYGEAAVDRSTLSDPGVEQRIGKFEIAARTIMLRRFDDFGLSPDIVKIDVQGHEMSVLSGMRKTIETCRPYFVIERSPADLDIQSMLDQWGYKPFVAGEDFRLKPYAPESGAVNMFLVPINHGHRQAQFSCLF